MSDKGEAVFALGFIGAMLVFFLVCMLGLVGLGFSLAIMFYK